jgi:hypothetical protein
VGVSADRHQHWIVPASGRVYEEEAAYLYDEGLSYGVIWEDQPGRWAWRHSFVQGYLTHMGANL